MRIDLSKSDLTLLAEESSQLVGAGQPILSSIRASTARKRLRTLYSFLRNFQLLVNKSKGSKANIVPQVPHYSIVVLLNTLRGFLLQLCLVFFLESSQNLFDYFEQVEKSTVAALEEAFKYAVTAFYTRSYPNAQVAMVLDRKVGEFVADRQVYIA